MKSELFKNSYCVFVDSQHSEHYNQLIQKENLIEKGVRLLNAKFNPNLSCIVISPTQNHNQIIDILWNNKKDGGFWHQYGIGYEGREWELC